MDELTMAVTGDNLCWFQYCSGGGGGVVGSSRAKRDD